MNDRINQILTRMAALEVDLRTAMHAISMILLHNCRHQHDNRVATAQHPHPGCVE